MNLYDFLFSTSSMFLNDITTKKVSPYPRQAAREVRKPCFNLARSEERKFDGVVGVPCVSDSAQSVGKGLKIRVLLSQ